MSYLALAKRIEATLKTKDANTGMMDGPIVAILIDSPVVGLVWFAFNNDFHSADDIPIFFASELPFLRKMSEVELRRRYDEKRVFGGGWIRSKIDEPTKH